MKKTIKKSISLFLVLCLTLAIFTGCGSASSETTTSANDSADQQTYTIGICQLVQHDALDRATQGFQDALVELLGEDNVTFDLQNAQGDSQMCATIANQFVSDDVDLIMANATASLQACANATSEIPVLATSVTSFQSALEIELDENNATGMNISGVNDLSPLELQAEMIADILPDAKKVGILYCSAEVNSVYQAEHIVEYLPDFGLEYEFYSFADSNELQGIVTKAVAESDVIYIPTDNTAASNTGVIDAVARPAGVPVIAAEEGICKGCGLASISIDFYEIGHRTGEQAYEILVNGADVSTMPTEDPQTLTYIYNPEIAEDLGITLGDEYTPITVE